QALIDMGMSPEDAAKTKLYRGAGCKVCNSTGYKGRIALYEVMPFIEPLKELVLQGASSAELKAEMIRQSVQSLRMSGLCKIMAGVTTPEEILRVTVGD
ncbi:MAG: type II secretion system protein GspE, partial [Pseudomonadota bacterium]